MAQFDCKDVSSCCFSDSSIANLSCYLQRNDPVSNLISQTPAMVISEQPDSTSSLETNSEQDSRSLDERSDSMNKSDYSNPAIDISSALGSVAVKQTWNIGKKYFALPKVLSLSLPEEDNSVSSSSSDLNQSIEGTDPVEDEVQGMFQLKYMNKLPLYQHYCLQNVREDLHRFNKSPLPELINPQHLQKLVDHLSSLYQTEAGSPQQCLAAVVPISSQPNVIKVTPFTLWQDLDKVKASGLLSKLTKREIRLQETIFELIGSEASYLRSLQITVLHFYASAALKQTLSQLEHHILFSNIQHVMAASEKFLMDLELRLGECVFISQVGDIVLQHCPAFHRLYVPYVTNMMYQEALISQLLQQNKDFIYSLQKLERDPVCQRQSLKSFLVLPFQRITRIKLILESILKLTEPESDSFQSLEKAIEAIHEVVMECNNGVQKMKRIEKLICLEMLFDFDKVKSVPLVISGRFLVHEGAVRQLIVEDACTSRMSFLSVYLHLFNDLLIISSKRDEQFIVLDHAEFPAQVRTEHLKTELLGLPTDSFLLHLTKRRTGQPTAMILVTDTSSAKEIWMNVLSSKQ